MSDVEEINVENEENQISLCNKSSEEESEIDHLFLEWKISRNGRNRLRTCGILKFVHLACLKEQDVFSRIFCEDHYVGDSIIFRTNLKEWQKRNQEKFPAVTASRDSSEGEMEDGESFRVHRKPKSLKDLLKSSGPAGASILQKAAEKDTLTKKESNELVNIIVTDHLKRDLQMTPKDFEGYTSAIVKLFPSESPLLYYKPRPSQKGGDKDKKKVKNPGGKLFNKWKNMKRKYKVPKIPVPDDLSSSSDTETDAVMQDDSSSVIAEKIEWLKEHNEPWDEVLTNWTETAECRLKDSSLILPNLYLDMCPGLKDEGGFELIDIDFKYRFSDVVQKSTEDIMTLPKKLLPIFSTDICDNHNKNLRRKLPECDEDSELCISSLLINAIIPPGNTTGNKKISISTAQNDMILRMSSRDAVQKTVDKWKEGSAHNDIKIIVTGKSYEKLEDSFVYCGPFLYKLPSFGKALEIYMKMSIFFGIKYSCKCKYAWQVLEGFFFNNLPSRSYDPKVENILKKLN